MFDLAVGMEGESSFAAIMDRVGTIPRPAPELGGSIVDHRLADLVCRVHDEWPHLEHRRPDRPTLEQKEFSLL